MTLSYMYKIPLGETCNMYIGVAISIIIRPRTARASGLLRPSASSAPPTSARSAHASLYGHGKLGQCRPLPDAIFYLTYT